MRVYVDGRVEVTSAGVHNLKAVVNTALVSYLIMLTPFFSLASDVATSQKKYTEFAVPRTPSIKAFLILEIR